MAEVVANMSMSLDGFIATPDDQVGPLFDWYQAGPVVTPSANEQWSYSTDEASAAQMREGLSTVGALICGRRLFEIAHAWNGRHPMGCPVFVVTHTVPEGWPRAGVPFTFVTDGIASAVAQAKATAGEKVVAVASPTIAQQCLNAGLLDTISVDLVPVLLGAGIPFFAGLRHTPVLLEDPTITPGTRVTHLVYRVKPR